MNLEASFKTTYNNLPLFQGRVIIKEKELANKEALLEYLKDLVIFTDGANKKRAGVGLV